MLLKRAALVSLALLVGGPLIADEMERPVITLSDVDWDAAAASVTGQRDGTAGRGFRPPQCHHR